jgi:hypothetical protein
MRTKTALISISILAGCAGAPTRPEAPAPAAAAVVVVPAMLAAVAPTATVEAVAPAAAAAAPSAHDRAIAELVGVWAGSAMRTPFGDFPFAIAFDREASGDVHGRLDDGRGMYLDFRFRRDGGRWMLVEEGAIPGAGTQGKTLAPAAGDAAARWTDGEPAYLAVELVVDAEVLVMTTTLGGEPHAVLRMQRVRGETADRIRQAIARNPHPVGE